MGGITEVAATWPKNVCTEERELEGGLGSNCISEPGTAVPRGLHPFPSGLPPALWAGACHCREGCGWAWPTAHRAFAIPAHVARVCSVSRFSPPRCVSSCCRLRWKNGVPGPSTA